MASGAPSAPPEQPWLEPVSQAIAAPLHERLRAGQRHLSGSVAQLALDEPSERVLTERVATELEQIADAATELCAKYAADLAGQAVAAQQAAEALQKQEERPSTQKRELNRRMNLLRQAAQKELTNQLTKQESELKRGWSERLAKAEAAERWAQQVGGAGLAALGTDCPVRPPGGSRGSAHRTGLRAAALRLGSLQRRGSLRWPQQPSPPPAPKTKRRRPHALRLLPALLLLPPSLSSPPAILVLLRVQAV